MKNLLSRRRTTLMSGSKCSGFRRRNIVVAIYRLKNRMGQGNINHDYYEQEWNAKSCLTKLCLSHCDNFECRY